MVFYLRANRLGYKFKRQVPIGRYIGDFACIEKRLIVELDGGQHLANQVYDEKRTLELNKRGFRVLRFWNDEVLRQTASVVEAIYLALSPTLSRAHHLFSAQPLSAGEGADRSES